jgi:hypothetical protein
MPIFKQKKKTEKDFRALVGTNIRLKKDIKKLNSKVEWFTVKGIPENSLGKNGDLCIDNDGTIYKKEGGKWS